MMKREMLFKLLGIPFGLLVLIVGCSTMPKPLQDDPDLTGFITEIHPVVAKDALMQILVESNVSKRIDKYLVTVNKDTVIFEQDQSEVREVDLGMVAINDSVELWFSGPVRESFPMQVTAEQIMITGTTNLTYHQLAAYWAPVLFQDVDVDNYRADYITNVDYDGDWNPLNNWDNLLNFKLNAYVYYWVSETTTHWFLGYAFFHPRDWSDDITAPLDQHENDMEGCLIVISKEFGRYGEFVLLITRAHEEFYSYKDYDDVISNEVRDGHEDIDGDVEFEEHHPYIYAKAEGHAVYGDLRWEVKDFPSNDGVVYRYIGKASEPSNSNDRNVGYDLVFIGDLWDKRDDSNLFYKFGTFHGDDWSDNKADAPWGWDDKDDGDVRADQFFLDPAYLVDSYHDGLGNFSQDYVFQFRK